MTTAGGAPSTSGQGDRRLFDRRRLKIGGGASCAFSQYFVGDRSNQVLKLPGSAGFNLRASYQIDKTFQVDARATTSSITAMRIMFDTNALANFYNGGAASADPRSLGMAPPRAFYAGLKATFSRQL
jgi:hypothetical protein